jgi:hypothetical protein
MKQTIITLSLVTSSLLSNAQSIKIGESVNIEGLYKTSQSAVFVESNAKIVGLIFRNNPATFGGSSGHFRFSRSTDAGSTWLNDFGPLNPAFLRTARFPSAAIIRQGLLNNTELVYQAVTNNTIPYTNGYVAGLTNIAPAGVLNIKNELYFAASGSARVSDYGGFINSQSNTINGGLFWYTELLRVNNTAQSTTDTLNLYRGFIDNGQIPPDLNFQKILTFTQNNASFGGIKRAKTPNVSFSPNGQIGYITYLGDIGTCDTTYNIIYYKTTDFGSTWSSANEIKIDNITGARDSLTSLSFIVGGQTRKISQVGTDSEFDITVDSLGNLHLLTALMAVEVTENNVVMPSNKLNYTSYDSYPKWLVDLHLNTAGVFECDYIAKLNKYKTILTPVANFWPFANYTIDNHPQIARSKTGSKLFYSWADTDPILYPSAVANDNPSLYISSKRLTDNYRTCNKKVTNITSANKVITPSMSEVILEKFNPPIGGNPPYTSYNLQIAYQQILTDAANPVDLHYAGNVARFCDQDYLPATSIDFSINGFCSTYTTCAASTVGVDEITSSLNDVKIYPNPSNGIYTIENYKDGELIITDILGKQILAQKMAKGLSEINLTTYNNGVYFIKIKSVDTTNVIKLIKE